MKATSGMLGRAAWLVVAVVFVIVTIATSFGPYGDATWEQPGSLFTLVVVTAAVCIVAATVVIAIADRREHAEAGLLGSAFIAASVMPLVHGLVTPEVLYDRTAAFDAAAFLSLPIAVAVAAPLLRPHSTFGRWAARHWRDWTLLSLLGVFAIAAVVVFLPDAIRTPGASDPLTITVSIAMVAAIGSLSLRQLRYYELGRRPANLVGALSLLALAGTALLPVAPRDYSPGFWWLHLAGPIGVVGASVGLLVSKRLSTTTRDVFAPVLTRDPLVAFELGLSPTVHRFVASLEDKDEITRDHMVRTAELALRVGERFRMPARDLRNLGLAALLHDVGKVTIPDEILKKPARLTAEEYELIKGHTVEGEAMVSAEATLADVAPIIRHHHERMDGRGYPDGLQGKDIPLASRIIAVCDALDAMTHDRQYRTAMPVKLAFAILREHAGTQWDPAVIEQVMAVLPGMPVISGLDEVGRAETAVAHAALDPATVPDEISDEMFDDVGALLVAVDAEI